MNPPATAGIQCSQRLGVITVAQFQAALDVFDLGVFVAAEPAQGGLFGQNVLLRSSKGSYVLRGCPHTDTQFAVERFFCRQVHERTPVPAPWPYLVEPSWSIFGWPFAIMRRMPGDCPDDRLTATLALADQVAVAAAMGRALAGLGEATMPSLGCYDLATDGIAPVPGGLRADRELWMSGMLEDAMRYCPATVAPERGWIDGIVAAAYDRALQPFPPTVSTSDFGGGNAVVQRTPDGWRCSGVFDFFEYSSGDLELSLTRPLVGYLGQDPAIPRAFVSGYAASRPLRAHARERLAFYALGDRLCIWNYGHSQATWFPPGLGFRAFAEPCIAGLLEIIAPFAR